MFAALSKILGSWPDLGSATAFAVRTWLTSVIAYWIACQFQLESPHWTMITVWTVVQPRAGMLLSKSLFFACGTLIGCGLGIILISFFAQTPELFIIALAAVMGIATLIANLLTNFRAFAAVLAGYTAAIVSLGAYNSPERVFDVAMARGAAILVAIGCAVIVAAVFAPHRARGEVLAGLKAVLIEAAHRAAFPWNGDRQERLKLAAGLNGHLISLNTMIEFAAAESGTFRIHRARATSLLVHVYGVFSAKRSLDAHSLRRGMPSDPALVALLERSFAFLGSISEKLTLDRIPEVISQVQDLRMKLSAIAPESLPLAEDDLVSHRVVIDRLDELLGEFAGAADDWVNLHGMCRDHPYLPMNFHRDRRAALINALRASLAVGALGSFWIASAWSSGSGALIYLSIICSLFSALPHPERIGWTFFQGSCVAIVAAFICAFCMLNFISDYELVALSLGVFLVPCGILMFYPRTAGYATAFAIVFLLEIAPANPMVYDVSAFLNKAVSTLGGVLCGTIAYLLIFPTSAYAARKYVVRRIRQSLESIARSRSRPATQDWTTRMYDRVHRLYDPQNLSASTTDEWLDAGLGSINLGCELLRARDLIASPGVPADLRAALGKVLAAFEQFRWHPELAAQTSKQALADLSKSQPGRLPKERLLWARGKGTIEEISACFEFPWSIINRPGAAARL